MALIRKIFSIIFKIIVGIFLLYLFLCWIAVPAIAPEMASQQATKMLKTSVRVRSVNVDPFFWAVTVKGFVIKDAQKNPVVGFERLRIDVSVMELLKKHYRVESVLLDGFFTNAVLNTNGTINLLTLIPAPAPSAPAQATTSVAKPKGDAPGSASGNALLPVITVDKIMIQNAKFSFEDKNLTPSFKTQVTQVNVAINNVTTDPKGQTDIQLSAILDQKGKCEGKAIIKPLAQPLELQTSLSINEYALTVLSPYVGKYTGRALKEGRFDFKIDYRIGNNQMNAGHKILIQHFEFGDKVESKDALHLPFGLAIALLEDPNGRININLPAKGDLSDPKFEYTHLIWQVVSNFCIKLMTKPFAILASAFGSESGTDDLGYVNFPVGNATVPETEKAKIAVLVKALSERPKLSIDIDGAYDLKEDWKAINESIFNNDFGSLSRETTRNQDWVYRELYQRRFGIRALWQITKQFKTKNGFDAKALNTEIKRQLIEEGGANKVALEALAQMRAKNVYDLFIAAGLNEKQVHIGIAKETQGSLGVVPLEFTLTVYDTQK